MMNLSIYRRLSSVYFLQKPFAFKKTKALKLFEQYTNLQNFRAKIGTLDEENDSFLGVMAGDNE